MKKSKKSNFLIILVVVVLLVFFHNLGFLKPVEGYLTRITTPIQSIFYKWGLSFTSFKNYKLLVEENQRLRDEVARLGLDYIKLANLEAENEYLKKEINFFKGNQY